MEEPQYSVSPSVGAVAVMQIAQLVLLCGFFYAGIIVNLSFLKMALPLWANLLAIVLLVFLSAVQIVITISKAKKYRYDFYPNRIEFYGKRLQSILYSEIGAVKTRRDFADLLAGTAMIVLSKKFKIKNIKNCRQIQEYINNLVQAFSSGTVQ